MATDPTPAPTPNVPISSCIMKLWTSLRVWDLVILVALAIAYFRPTLGPTPPNPTPPTPVSYISLPATVNIPTGKLVQLHAVTDNPDVQWAVVGDGGEIGYSPKDSQDAYVTGPDKSSFTVLACTTYLDGPNKGKPAPIAKCKVTVGDVPPGPGPTPPPPGPTPIPGDGPHALIVYDSDPGKYSAYTKTQVSALTGDKVNAYLATHFKSNWRRFPDNADAKNDAQVWQDALKLPRASLPWVIASDAKTGKFVNQAIPANGFTDEDMVKLLQQVGGP